MTSEIQPEVRSGDFILYAGQEITTLPGIGACDQDDGTVCMFHSPGKVALGCVEHSCSMVIWVTKETYLTKKIIGELE